jgi:hypothetical protein
VPCLIEHVLACYAPAWSTATLYHDIMPDCNRHIAYAYETAGAVAPRYESATEGDSFICAFHGPDAAVLFCLRLVDKCQGKGAQALRLLLPMLLLYKWQVELLDNTSSTCFKAEQE